MPIATPEQYGRMLDAAQAGDYAYPAINVTSLTTINAALKAFAGRSSLGTYVAVIATRSATRGFSRRHSVGPSTDDCELAQTAPDQTTKDPVSELIEAEQQQRLHLLLDQLPPKQRNVVCLFHLHGNSYAEISESLAIPIGSIGPTLRRAEAKLREWMEGD